MDLGIQSQECNQCGAMIYPHDSISTKGEKVRIEKHILPEDKKDKKDKMDKIDKKETDYKKKAKKVTRTETETEVTLEIERHLAVLEGDEINGNQKCPICGFVLVTWKQ